MLNELDILEIRAVAELAAAARQVWDRLLAAVPERELGEVSPQKGVHDPVVSLTLNDVLGDTPAYRALAKAITDVSPAIRRELMVVAEIGRGDRAILDWEQGLADVSAVNDGDMIAALIGDADLHAHLRKGLYALGAATVPGDKP